MDFPRVDLNDGQSIPAIGLGTGTAWFKDGGKGPFDRDLVELLQHALSKGFHHIDGAESYGTEEEMGAAIKACGIHRDQLFVTSKVQDSIFNIPQAIDESLRKLQLDYLDLYLIHWPYFGDENKDLQKAWKEMEKLRESGKVKSIGVSNFLRPHLESVLQVATVVPAVNQIEHHPYLQRANDYVPWMQSQGIRVEAFKPLVSLTLAKGGPLDEPVRRIAEAHEVPVDAVLLKWQLQKGIVPITTTRKVSRLDEYTSVNYLTLSDQEMDTITSIGLTYHFRAWGRDRFAPDDHS